MFPLGRHLLRSGQVAKNLAKMSTSQIPTYETLSVTVPKEYVYQVELARPDRLNAMNHKMWLEIGECFQHLDGDENCRVIMLTGAGKLFCAGLDLTDSTMASLLGGEEDPARRAKIIHRMIGLYQDSMSSLERCKKPVLAAVHSACVGGGINMVSSACMRYSTKDAWFQIKEVAIGLAADVGVLQRLPRLIGSDSLARELAYTARKFPAEEALKTGFVSAVFDNKEEMVTKVLSIAEQIAQFSPVAVQGTKYSMVYARDHSVQEGLDQMKLWNQLMLQSEDFPNAIAAQLTKEKAVFAKL